MSKYLVNRLRAIESMRSDRQQINALLAEFSPRSTPLSLAELYDIIRNSFLFVARNENEQIVGMATLAVYRKPTGKVGIVEDVVVAAAHRGQGLGRQLMARVLHEAAVQRLRHLELTSHASREAAHGLYRSLGFAERDTTVFRLAL